MGILSSIEIDFKEKYSSMELIKYLLQNGFSFSLDGQIWYLPLGDNGLFNWNILPLSEIEEIYKIINKKISAGECIGLNLIIQDGVGGSFLFYENDKSLQIILDVNRKKIEGSRDTDFDWYIRRLNAVFDDFSVPIINIYCEDAE